MGCSHGAPAIPVAKGVAARPDPETREVTLPAPDGVGGGPPLRVGLASPSLVYCLLAAGGDGVIVIDARPHPAYDRGHLCSYYTIMYYIVLYTIR